MTSSHYNATNLNNSHNLLKPFNLHYSELRRYDNIN